MRVDKHCKGLSVNGNGQEKGRKGQGFFVVAGKDMGAIRWFDGWHADLSCVVAPTSPSGCVHTTSNADATLALSRTSLIMQQHCLMSFFLAGAEIQILSVLLCTSEYILALKVQTGPQLMPVLMVALRLSRPPCSWCMFNCILSSPQLCLYCPCTRAIKPSSQYHSFQPSLVISRTPCRSQSGGCWQTTSCSWAAHLNIECNPCLRPIPCLTYSSRCAWYAVGGAVGVGLGSVGSQHQFLIQSCSAGSVASSSYLW